MAVVCVVLCGTRQKKSCQAASLRRQCVLMCPDLTAMADVEVLGNRLPSGREQHPSIPAGPRQPHNGDR